MAKRGLSGLSLVVGVNKPAGMTSHDVVNACRRIYGERRVGHTGTLDPAATGAMAVCIGPATRLDRFVAGHRKIYEFTIVFGSSTDTDDAQGQVIDSAAVPERLADKRFADSFVHGLVGDHQQMPPLYSAIKVDGKKSCDVARKGHVIDLKPRAITIYSAAVLAIETGSSGPIWRCRMDVSGGTYVRSIARDAGKALGTFAHVGELHRVRSGNLDLSACATLEDLSENPQCAILDPVKLLGLRFLFATPEQAADVSCGKPLRTDKLALFEYDRQALFGGGLCNCSSGVCPTDAPLAAGENIGIIADNLLVAIYGYDAEKHLLKSSCGFSIGVKRGSDI